MNLNDIVGGSVNRFGGMDRADYSPSSFSVNNAGVISDGYRDSGFRVGGDGSIRDSYGNLSDVRISPFGTVDRVRTW